MDALVWIAMSVGAVGIVLGIIALIQVRQANLLIAEVTPGTRGLAHRIRGKTGEEAIQAIFSHLEDVSRRMGAIEVATEELDRVVSRAIRRVGLVRFDAHDGISGELSFALAMLDNRDNGMLLSSVYTLEGCRVFVRGIINGKTQHDLMPEEAEALQQALGEP